MTPNSHDKHGVNKPDQSQTKRDSAKDEDQILHADRLLETKIGPVIGGVEAAKRFNDLLAKTLKLKDTQ
jgi:hypothetical protein